MTTEAEPFHAQLRRFRQAATLSQEALAGRARLSSDAVSQLERGRRTRPRLETVRLLAEALALCGEQRSDFEAAARRPASSVLGAAHLARVQPEGRVVPLVGRSQELALLERHMAAEGPPLLLLAGEPGIGKSRLLAEVARQGAGVGWQVLHAGCTRSGGQFPYAPILQALQRQIGGYPAAEQRVVLRGCAWLVRLIPELADGPIEPLPSWTVSPEQERRLLFGAVERFLANAAGPSGTLLVLDDLQWAGADALDLLATLAHGGAAPLRIVGAYRDTEVRPTDPLAVILADLAYAGLVRHLLLPPLTAREVRHLLDALLDGITDDRAVLAARIARRTGGVPFYVVSCAQALRSEAAGGAAAIPWDATQGIRQRAAALPALAREVLGAAAIAVGRAAQAPVLAAVLEQPERTVLAALEAAWRARLLEDVDGSYRIAHDLIREVLEADLGPARRALLHRRTAEVLERRPGAAPDEVLAYHYARGDMPERAAGYLERAGDQARAQQGRAAAEGFYREAVAWLDRLGRPLDVARVHEKLGALLRTGARYAEALAALEPAADIHYATGDLEAAGRVVAEIALVHTDRGTAIEGSARLQPALDLLAGRGPSAALAGLYATQADLFYMLGRLHENVAATEQAERIARLVGDDGYLVIALESRGAALLMLGRLAEAVQALTAAIRVAEAVGDYNGLCWALTRLGMSYQEGGSFATARAVLERSLELAERHDFRMIVAFTTMQRGWLAFLTGEWIAARRDFEQAAAMSGAIGPFMGSIVAPLGLGALCLAEGGYAEASRHLEKCARLLRAGGDGNARRHAACALAERDLLVGHPEAAHARLAPLLQQEEDTVPMLPHMAWALLDLDEVGEAAEVATSAVARAQGQGRQVLLVDALRIAALVAARQGRREETEGTFQEGLSLAQRLGYPYGEARLLQVAGELSIQSGQPEPARERLEAARTIFRRLGAHKALERTEQLLATIS